MSDYNLKLVKNRKDRHPFPYVVFSHETFDLYQKPFLVESWMTLEEAMHCAKYRQDSGYVVNVYKEFAHSENRA